MPGYRHARQVAAVVAQKYGQHCHIAAGIYCHAYDRYGVAFIRSENSHVTYGPF